MRDDEAASSTKVKTSPETIVRAAERLIAKYGYQKTTVLDIASSLGMSPANVYRFFRSKEELRRAVFVRILDASYLLALRYSSLPIDSDSRIRRYLRIQHSTTIKLMNNRRAMYDLVVLSFDRDPDLVDRHIGRISDILAAVIANGIGAATFAGQDAHCISRTFIMATSKVWHPKLLLDAQSGYKGSQSDDLIDFALSALKLARLSAIYEVMDS